MQGIMRNLVFGLFLLPIALFGAADPVCDRILVLTNDRVLEGEIERKGDRIVIRRGDAENSIPAVEARFVGPDLKSAYQFLQSKADLKRAEERLRLAQWCHDNRLRTESLVEIDAALNLKPNWLPALTLLQQIKNGTGSSSKPVDSTSTRADAIDCSPEATKLFNTKVQPILMNLCAGCHATGKAGSLELRRFNSASTTNQENSQFNLDAAIRQVNRKDPAKSPLLLKAITVHGGTNTPPIKDANAPTFKHLEQWVKLLTVETKRFDPNASPSKSDSSPTGPKDEFDPIQFNRKTDG